MKTGQLEKVQVQLMVVLGKTKKDLADVAQIGEGSIIELDRLAGEPVDLYAGDIIIAKGEVVVIDENFGIRISKLVTEPSIVKEDKNE